MAATDSMTDSGRNQITVSIRHAGKCMSQLSPTHVKLIFTRLKTLACNAPPGRGFSFDEQMSISAPPAGPSAWLPTSASSAGRRAFATGRPVWPAGWRNDPAGLQFTRSLHATASPDRVQRRSAQSCTYARALNRTARLWFGSCHWSRCQTRCTRQLPSRPSPDIHSMAAPNTPTNTSKGSVSGVLRT